jgi:hypothetical protein
MFFIHSPFLPKSIKGGGRIDSSRQPEEINKTRWKGNSIVK